MRKYTDRSRSGILLLIFLAFVWCFGWVASFAMIICGVHLETKVGFPAIVVGFVFIVWLFTLVLMWGHFWYRDLQACFADKLPSIPKAKVVRK